MGWSHRGNTRQRYQHYFQDDALDAILVADGLVSPDAAKKKKDILKPKVCPNCSETNIPDSKFCIKCRFVLSYDAFNEALEEKEKAQERAEQNEKRIQALEFSFRNLIRYGGPLGPWMRRQPGGAADFSGAIAAFGESAQQAIDEHKKRAH
jgi:hypothetical protein